MIENLAAYLKCTRIEAIIDHCESTGMEIEVAKTLISHALKAKLREEAQNANLIRKTESIFV